MFTKKIPALLAATLSLYTSTALSNPVPRADSDDTYVLPSNGDCSDFSIKETITAEVPTWDYPHFKDNDDVAAYLGLTAVGIDPFSETGDKNITETYTLSGHFCKPKETKDGLEKTVLVATHGSGFDGR